MKYLKIVKSIFLVIQATCLCFKMTSSQYHFKDEDFRTSLKDILKLTVILKHFNFSVSMCFRAVR